MWISNKEKIAFCSIPVAFEVGYYYTFCLDFEGINEEVETQYNNIGLTIEQYFDPKFSNWCRFYPNLPYFYADFDTTVLCYILALNKKNKEQFKHLKIEEKISEFLEASRLNKTKDGWVQAIDYLKNIQKPGQLEMSNIFYLALLYKIGLDEPEIELNIINWLKKSKTLTNDRYHNLDFIYFTIKRLSLIVKNQNPKLSHELNNLLYSHIEKTKKTLILKFEHLNPDEGVFKHKEIDMFLHFHKPKNPPMIDSTKTLRLQKQLFDYYESRKVLSEIELIDQLKGQGNK